jgi:hypothetical protein
VSHAHYFPKVFDELQARKEGAQIPLLGCPLSVEGMLRGEMIRRSLDLRNWEAAQKLVRDWEIDGKELDIAVQEATDKYLDDVVARKLSPATIRKYRHHIEEIKAAWGEKRMRSITVDEVRTLRKSWNHSGLTTTKRLEFVRGFFQLLP